jgi:hypothetical protein
MIAPAMVNRLMIAFALSFRRTPDRVRGRRGNPKAFRMPRIVAGGGLIKPGMTVLTYSAAGFNDQT